MNVEVVCVPTVREADGLALSSRNAYLSADARARAAALPRALQEAKAAIEKGGDVAAALADARSALIAAGFDAPDYVAHRYPPTLAPLPPPARHPSTLPPAARPARTRLDRTFARARSRQA